MNNCLLLVPVFPGNDGVLIPGNPGMRTAGNPGRPGNGSPGMKTLIKIYMRCGGKVNWFWGPHQVFAADGEGVEGWGVTENCYYSGKQCIAADLFESEAGSCPQQTESLLMMITAA